MDYLERLTSLVGSKEFQWRTNAEVWAGFDFAARSILPSSFFKVLDRFGHGAWGETLTLLHPLAQCGEKLSLENLRETHRMICEIQNVYPKELITDWKFVPLSFFHDTFCLLWLPEEQQIAVYDADFRAFTNSGHADLAEFLVCMITNQHVQDDLCYWRDEIFDNLPVFTPVDPKLGLTAA